MTHLHYPQPDHVFNVQSPGYWRITPLLSEEHPHMAWDGQNGLLIIPISHKFLFNKRPKGPHIVHPSTICHLFEESAKANIFVDWSAR